MNKIILEIKNELKKQGISQARIARLAGVEQRTVNRLLAGLTKKPDISVVQKLQSALGINVEAPIAADPGVKYGDPLKVAVEEEINKLDRVELADLLSQLLKKARERKD